MILRLVLSFYFICFVSGNSWIRKYSDPLQNTLIQRELDITKEEDKSSDSPTASSRRALSSDDDDMVEVDPPYKYLTSTELDSSENDMKSDNDENVARSNAYKQDIVDIMTSKKTREVFDIPDVFIDSDSKHSFSTSQIDCHSSISVKNTILGVLEYIKQNPFQIDMLIHNIRAEIETEFKLFWYKKNIQIDKMRSQLGLKHDISRFGEFETYRQCTRPFFELAETALNAFSELERFPLCLETVFGYKPTKPAKHTIKEEPNTEMNGALAKIMKDMAKYLQTMPEPIQKSEPPTIEEALTSSIPEIQEVYIQPDDTEDIPDEPITQDVIPILDHPVNDSPQKFPDMPKYSPSQQYPNKPNPQDPMKPEYYILDEPFLAKDVPEYLLTPWPKYRPSQKYPNGDKVKPHHQYPTNSSPLEGPTQPKDIPKYEQSPYTEYKPTLNYPKGDKTRPKPQTPTVSSPQEGPMLPEYIPLDKLAPGPEYWPSQEYPDPTEYYPYEGPTQPEYLSEYEPVPKHRPAQKYPNILKPTSPYTMITEHYSQKDHTRPEYIPEYELMSRPKYKPKQKYPNILEPTSPYTMITEYYSQKDHTRPEYIPEYEPMSRPKYKPKQKYPNLLKPTTPYTMITEYYSQKDHTRPEYIPGYEPMSRPKYKPKQKYPNILKPTSPYTMITEYYSQKDHTRPEYIPGYEPMSRPKYKPKQKYPNILKPTSPYTMITEYYSQKDHTRPEYIPGYEPMSHPKYKPKQKYPNILKPTSPYTMITEYYSQKDHTRPEYIPGYEPMSRPKYKPKQKYPNIPEPTSPYAMITEYYPQEDPTRPEYIPEYDPMSRPKYKPKQKYPNIPEPTSPYAMITEYYPQEDPTRPEYIPEYDPMSRPKYKPKQKYPSTLKPKSPYTVITGYHPHEDFITGYEQGPHSQYKPIQKYPSIFDLKPQHSLIPEYYPEVYPTLPGYVPEYVSTLLPNYEPSQQYPNIPELKPKYTVIPEYYPQELTLPEYMPTYIPKPGHSPSQEHPNIFGLKPESETLNSIKEVEDESPDYYFPETVQSIPQLYKPKPNYELQPEAYPEHFDQHNVETDFIKPNGDPTSLYVKPTPILNIEPTTMYVKPEDFTITQAKSRVMNAILQLITDVPSVTNIESILTILKRNQVYFKPRMYKILFTLLHSYKNGLINRNEFNRMIIFLLKKNKLWNEEKKQFLTYLVLPELNEPVDIEKLFIVLSLIFSRDAYVLHIFDNTLPLLRPIKEGRLDERTPDIILTLLTQYKKRILSPDQINTILLLIKPNKNGRVLPIYIDIVVPLINWDQISYLNPEHVQIIFSLLRPNVNGKFDRRAIEIIRQILTPKKAKFLTKRDIKMMLSFLKTYSGILDPKRVDIVLFILKNIDRAPRAIDVLIKLLNNDEILYSKYIDILLALQRKRLLTPKLLEGLIYLVKQEKTGDIDQHVVNNILLLLEPYKITHPKIVIDIYNQLRPEPTSTNFNFNLNTVPDDMKELLYNLKHSTDDNQQTTKLDLLSKILQILQWEQEREQATDKVPNDYGVLELTYMLKHHTPLWYYPLHYVKYRIPLVSFLADVKTLIAQKPQLTADPARLLQEFINEGSVSEVSPNLKGYRRADILKLTYKDGDLVQAKVLDHKSVSLNEQIKQMHHLNTDISPEDILQQNKWNAETYYLKSNNFQITTENSLSPSDLSNLGGFVNLGGLSHWHSLANMGNIVNTGNSYSNSRGMLPMSSYYNSLVYSPGYNKNRREPNTYLRTGEEEADDTTEYQNITK